MQPESPCLKEASQRNRRFRLRPRRASYRAPEGPTEGPKDDGKTLPFPAPQQGEQPPGTEGTLNGTTALPAPQEATPTDHRHRPMSLQSRMG